MKKILVAIDFSDVSARVLHMAGDLARTQGAELHLVHVMEPEPTYSAYGFTGDDLPAMREYHEEARKRARRALDKRVADVGGGVVVRERLLDGRPVDEILEHATQEKIDLIIVGSHGHGAIASLFLGSVAESLVRRAKFPVLVVPAAS
ncbi:MAG: universal stress protein [Verrucomicrobiales bacterium]